MFSKKKLLSLLLVLFLLLPIFPAQALTENPRPESEIYAAEAQKRRIEPRRESLVLPFDAVTVSEEDMTALSSPPGTIASIFPDPGLATAVAEAFQTVDPLVTVNTAVNQTHLNAVSGLLANNRNIRNLQGMQFLNNLRWAEFERNQISNLAPLANLQSLEELVLIANNIADIRPLAGLTNLMYLELDHNNIANLQPLSDLTRLEVLGLVDNDIQNIQILSGLSNLRWLDLDGNHISNIQPLSALTRLEVLGLSFNWIGDLRPLSGMARLQEICVEYQRVYLPPVVLRNPLTLENPVFNIAGQAVPPAPGSITHGGTFQAPHLIWANLPGTTAETRWSFAHILEIGSAVGLFSGMVRQPLVDSDTPFPDVPRQEWFHDAVYLVHSRGYMTGISESSFRPHENLTRAMVAAILHRMEGRPAVVFYPIFTDVPATAAPWYRDAVVWAAEQAIVQGRPGGIFAPHDPITREEFAIMMYRFADMRGLLEPIADSFDLTAFPDYVNVSGWAFDQMRWAAYHELIRGTPSGTIDPQGLTSRAACAVIIARFISQFEG